jgi:hypothetical protein
VNIYTATRIYREHMEPTADPRELEWQDAALCAQSDPEAWFPEKGASAHFPSRSAGPARSASSAWATHLRAARRSVSGVA